MTHDPAPTPRDSAWYHDEDTLLAELRSTNPAPPMLAGYAEFHELARGGQGVVYRAEQRSTGRTVAIKFLYEGPTAVMQRRARFEREVELAALLRHPNIVQIYDGGVTDDGRLYVVMEFLAGVPLDQFITPPAAPPKEWVRCFIEVCRGVGHAHRRGVIHRDLKPTNILVDADGVPHVLDFGIARSLASSDQSSTKTNEFVGTLGFAAPEQLVGGNEAIDVRSDVYALGVMLYRVLTGQAPYDTSGSLASAVAAVRDQQPIRPSRLVPAINADLDAVVMKALAKDPEDRYQSVDELAADLQHYLAGEAVLARSDRRGYVLLKALRKHRVKVAIGSGMLAALIAFSAATTMLWQRSVIEQQRTNDIKVFWEDTLGSISAGEQDVVSFEEVLDEAVHWVAMTANDPETEASLRLTIGNGYRCVGRFAAANEQLRRVLEIRSSEDDLGWIQATNALAMLRRSEGRLEEAQALFEQGAAAREQRLGPRHPDVAQSLQNLGRLHLERQRLEEADACFGRALEIRLHHFGPESPAVATVLYNRGDVAAARQDFVAAGELHRQALQIRQQRLSPTHPDLARSLVALATVQRDQARQQARPVDEETVALARQALQIRQMILRAGHPLIDEVQRLLAELHRSDQAPAAPHLPAAAAAVF
ncbi:MAG: serine/threonine-protein kinase [Planctomycetota bacterium]